MGTEVILSQAFYGWSDGERAMLRHIGEAIAETIAGETYAGETYAGWTDTGWGISDEGDPWFALCDARTGEQLLHIARLGNARLGNAYVASAPALNGTVHARDLRTLIMNVLPRLDSVLVSMKPGRHPAF